MKQLLILIGFLLLFSSSHLNVDDLTKVTTNFKKENTKISSKILFSKKQGTANGWSIYTINPDGTNEEILIPYKSGMGEYNPAVSPDGKTILFNTYRYGGWKLATYDIESKTIKRITLSSKYYFFNGVYSPDGKSIAYERNVQRATHIFIADSDGKNERILTAKMGDENRVPVWTADGKSIVFYSEKNKRNDIYQVDIETRTVKNLTNNNAGNDFNPSVSPNGKKIAFYSDRNGFLDLYLMDISGENQVNLTANLQNKSNEYDYYKDYNIYWIFKNSWSPDGKKLVFSNTKSDNTDLFIVNTDGTNLKQITFTSKSEYTPVWNTIRNQY